MSTVDDSFVYYFPSVNRESATSLIISRRFSGFLFTKFLFVGGGGHIHQFWNLHAQGSLDFHLGIGGCCGSEGHHSYFP